MDLRTKLLLGEEVEEVVEQELEPDTGNDDLEAARAKRTNDFNSIMYNSDDEEGQRAPEKPKPKKKIQVNLFDMIKEPTNDEVVNDLEINSDSSESENEINPSKINRKKRILIDSSDSENEETNNKSNTVEIVDDVNTMVSSNSSEVQEPTNNKNKKRERSLDSDSSNSDGEINVRAKKVKNVRRLISDDEEED